MKSKWRAPLILMVASSLVAGLGVFVLVRVLAGQEENERAIEQTDKTARKATVKNEEAEDKATRADRLSKEIIRYLRGQDGIDGVPGRNGVDGSRGPGGLRGRPGRPGSDGAVGRPGEQGIPGIPGSDGRNGIDCTDGRDASQDQVNASVTALCASRSDGCAAGPAGATGATGATGPAGADGAPGPQGAPGTTTTVFVYCTAPGIPPGCP